MMNALGVTELCVTTLCADARPLWNGELPPSILGMGDIDMATDSTCIVVSNTAKTNALKYFTVIGEW